MRAVDTNVLVRMAVGDEPRQTAIAEQFIEGGAWASVVAVAEAVWVLGSVYKLDPPDLADVVQMLLDNRDLVVQDSDAVVEALALFRERPSLGFSDCLIFHLAVKAGHLPLGTFDRSLARVDGTQRL